MPCGSTNLQPEQRLWSERLLYLFPFNDVRAGRAQRAGQHIPFAGVGQCVPLLPGQPQSILLHTHPCTRTAAAADRPHVGQTDRRGAVCGWLSPALQPGLIQ